MTPSDAKKLIADIIDKHCKARDNVVLSLEIPINQGGIRGVSETVALKLKTEHR